jgi:RNA polymerase sigma factor (sigma-70 family)
MTNPERSRFESLYEANHPMVFQMCIGFMKGDRDLAYDLSQEVFINIWNGLASFKGESSHKTWIYRITVNTCLQFIRKEKNKIPMPVTESLAAGQSSPQEEENRLQELYHAIGRLQEIDRLIIMLVLDELDYDEIAQIVGIQPANLRVKIHRIKKRLKELMI